MKLTPTYLKEMVKNTQKALESNPEIKCESRNNSGFFICNKNECVPDF